MNSMILAFLWNALAPQEATRGVSKESSYSQTVFGFEELESAYRFDFYIIKNHKYEFTDLVFFHLDDQFE